NYNFLARLGYRVAPHVYFDIFGTANNARNYATQTVGFSLKFLVHRLPTNTDLHVNSIPDWKGNQPFGVEYKWYVGWTGMLSHIGTQLAHRSTIHGDGESGPLEAD